MLDVIEGRIPEFNELRVGVREGEIVALGVFFDSDEYGMQNAIDEYILGIYPSVKEAIAACSNIYNNYDVSVVLEPEAKELLGDSDEE